MSIMRKWLLIVAIPLAFELLFVLVFLFFHDRESQEVEKQIRSNAAKELMDKITYQCNEAAWLGAEITIKPEPKLVEEGKALSSSTRSMMGQLKKSWYSSDPRQLEALNDLELGVDNVCNLMENAQKASNLTYISGPEQAILGIMLNERIVDVTEPISRLLIYQDEVDKEIKSQRTEAGFLVRAWLILSVFGNIILTAFLATCFSKDIIQRIASLKDNSLRLALGKSFTQSTKGQDEIAEFDEDFFHVATALRESLDRESANFDNAGDAVFAMDSAGRITRANKAFQTTISQGKEVEQSRFIEYVSTGQRDWMLDVLKNGSFSDGARHDFELEMLSTNDSIKIFQWSLNWDPKIKVYILVGHDITAYKQLEQAKQDFVAMLSHDLRSPLMSIGSTFELVQSGSLGAISDATKVRFQRAQSSVKRLTMLISELLDLEKIEAGEIDLRITRFPVDRAISSSIDAVRASADIEKIDLYARECGIAIFADEDRLVRVLINLLSNAIKFSPEQSSIEIEAVEQNDSIRFSVTDHGPGIPEAAQNRIFERYKQVSNARDRVKQGTGLGLAICKAIVEAHGGVIGVRSVEDQGSTFWFQIPLLRDG